MWPLKVLREESRYQFRMLVFSECTFALKQACHMSCLKQLVTDGAVLPLNQLLLGTNCETFKRKLSSFWVIKNLSIYFQVQPGSRSSKMSQYQKQKGDHIDKTVSTAKFRRLQLCGRIQGGLTHQNQFPLLLNFPFMDSASGHTKVSFHAMGT